MDREQLDKLKTYMKDKGGIVVEWLPLVSAKLCGRYIHSLHRILTHVVIQSEAMATFNILNGEDRMVATALVLDKDESHYVSDTGDS